MGEQRKGDPLVTGRPRILVLFGNVPLLGQELGNIDVLHTLKSEGCEVLFLIRREWTKDTIQAELSKRGLRWETVPYVEAIRLGKSIRVWMNNVIGIIGGSVGLLYWRFRFKPTHIHVANPESFLNFLPALLLLRTPIIYRAGDAPTLHHWLWRWVYKFVVRRTTLFASISDYVDGELIKIGVSPDKIVRVSTISPGLLVRATAHDAQVPGRCDTAFTFVYVGQITQQKGVDLLVDAAITYCRQNRDCRFLLAGDYSWNNPLAEDLLRRVALAGYSDRIRLLGYVNAIDTLLETADVHVCPSVGSEALGNVVMEAKTHGKPSIIFPTGGLAELVTDGVDGHVCKELTSAALVEAFASYLADPDLSRRQGTAAGESVARIQGEVSFVDQWNAVYGNRGPHEVAVPAVSDPSLPRIIVLFGNIPLLGQERSNIDALEYLRDSGCEVLFLIRGDRTKDTIQAELNRRRLTWLAVPHYYAARRGYGLKVWLPNVAGIVGGSWQLIRQVRRFKPTHIHAANPEHILNFLPGLMWVKTPLIYRAGDAPTVHHWVWRLVTRFSVRRAERFASISGYVDGELIKLGVRPEQILRVSTQAASLLDRGPSTSGEVVPSRQDELLTFVYVGQITAQKGVDRLIEAAIAYCQQSSGCRFLLAGNYNWGNAMADELLHRIKQRGLSDRIVFLGYVNAVGALLSISDVHICPSVGSEALGNVVVEAKLQGKPSIIFPTGGLVELVTHGVDGYVSPDLTSAALQEAFSVYDRNPGLALAQGLAARESLARLQGNLSYGEQWNAVYGIQ